MPRAELAPVAFLMTPLGPITATLLEKAALDNGFDRELERAGTWLAFASTQAPLRIWLTAIGSDLYLLAVSQPSVARALVDNGTAFASPLPNGASGARSFVNLAALHRAVRRAFQLSNTLPDELLHRFEAATAGLPRATEVERIVVQRVGQDLFRAGLIELWEGRCAVTGLAVPALLRASHIKPWADCDTDTERLDVYNGLLLAPNLDAAFDGGFVTVDADGRVQVSATLDASAVATLGLDRALTVRRLSDAHRAYLRWHHERVWRDRSTGAP